MSNEKVEGKTWEVLAKKCEDIGYGEWEIKLVIFKGKCIGFDQTKEPIIKFREFKEK